MKVLHIFRSEPDDMVKMFVKKLFLDEETHEVHLSQAGIDYDQLIEQIFNCDRVICWWYSS